MTSYAQFSPIETLAQFIAAAIVLLAMFASGNMQELRFKRTMFWVSALTLLLVLYGIISGGALVQKFGVERFRGNGFATSTWAEISLGLIFSAMLSEKKVLVVACVAVSGLVIIATEVRTSGLSAIVGFSVYLIVVGMEREITLARAVLYSGIIFVVVLVSIGAGSYLSQAISSALLLNDPYRGISSGFAGRFENVQSGIEQFLSSPLWGGGVTETSPVLVHNGYIKLLAEYGLIFSFPFFGLLFFSLYSAFKFKQATLAAVIAGLLVFYLAQPRHLSFQLMPFVGLIAVGRVFTSTICGQPRISRPSASTSDSALISTGQLSPTKEASLVAARNARSF